MKKLLYGKKSPFLFSLTVFCLTILLIAPMGCGDKTNKPAAKEEAKTIEAPAPAAQADPNISNFAYFTDLHFNPFYDTTLMEQLINADASQWESIFQTSKIKDFGKIGGDQETNYNLLISSFENMAKSANNPKYIIFTGDFIAHEFPDRFQQCAKAGDDYHAFVDKTFTFIALMLEKYFPGLPVYFTLGNNDSYSGDYKLVADGDFLHNSAVYLSKYFLPNETNKTSFAETYPVGGYYTATPPGNTSTRIISFNSIFYSGSSKATKQTDAQEKEIQWFEEQLKQIRQNNQKAWIVTHIPPGPDVYKYINSKEWKCQWQEDYLARFTQLLEAYAPEISAGFCGHTHMDDWRVLLVAPNSTQPLVYFHISPAISPEFGNNPAYQEITYKLDSFILTNYVMYYLNLESENSASTGWQQEYSFNQAYSQTSLTAATVNTLRLAIDANQNTRDNYIKFYNASNTANPGLTDETWKAYWCAIGKWDKDGFERCSPLSQPQ